MKLIIASGTAVGIGSADGSDAALGASMQIPPSSMQCLYYGVYDPPVP